GSGVAGVATTASLDTLGWTTSIAMTPRSRLRLRAILKRQIIGIHHWVSPKHLLRYAAEMTWRFNHRDLSHTDRMDTIFGGMEGRLRYKALIA
ncbi:transposase, partial [Methylobacterium sp. 2A]|uniref:transposase n=2 Tax=unclassified Methylobacterium TaxID=2615210 RepID=UPI001AEF0E4D